MPFTASSSQQATARTGSATDHKARIIFDKITIKSKICATQNQEK